MNSIPKILLLASLTTALIIGYLAGRTARGTEFENEFYANYKLSPKIMISIYRDGDPVIAWRVLLTNSEPRIVVNSNFNISVEYIYKGKEFNK
jgi:hypothetical protein